MTLQLPSGAASTQRGEGWLGLGLFNYTGGANALEPILKHAVAQIHTSGLDKTMDNKIAAEFFYFTTLHYFLVANGRFLIRTDTKEAPTAARYWMCVAAFVPYFFSGERERAL